MATAKTADEIEVEAVLARFKALTEDWPYDLNAEMTDEQMAAVGANNVTDQNSGVGVVTTIK